MTSEFAQDNDPDHLSDAPSHQRLCWSSWPCPKCNGGVTPIGYLRNRLEAGSLVLEDSPEKIRDIQIGWLQDWVLNCVHGSKKEIEVLKLSEGSEHLVFYQSEESPIYKATRAGMFGESYFLVNNVINQKNCSPLEYLLRLRIWRKLFDSAPKDLGITTQGQVVSTQEFISGVEPNQSDVDSFLASLSFEPVKQNCWLWKKVCPEYEIWLGDARKDYFVQTKLGVVPIDIRLGFTNPTIAPIVAPEMLIHL